MVITVPKLGDLFPYRLEHTMSMTEKNSFRPDSRQRRIGRFHMTNYQRTIIITANARSVCSGP